MFSALQGKIGGINSASPDPFPGLQYPRITSRCAHIRSSIASLPLKELHQFFPHLLSNIFGFDHSESWGLRLFNKTQHSDFHQLLQFLSPNGDLFQLIDKLDNEGFIYEFPVECLPRPSQQAITEGILPPLYADKLQLSFTVDNSPTHIFLSAFQYYIFHFAYYLIHSQISHNNKPSIDISSILYTHMLDSYLIHYLPFAGTIPSPVMCPLTQGSPYYSFNTSPGLNASVGSSIGRSPIYKRGVTSELGGVGSNTFQVSPPYKQTVQHVHSETFVQVLVEFWLNQNTYNGGKGNLLAQAQNQFTPNEEHLVLLRRFLKQVHFFVSGYSYCPGITTLNSGLIPITDTLRSSLIPAHIQRKLYYFLDYSFKHSALDFNFRFILELWLTFIQPWRYIDPSKPSTENKESFENLPKRWCSFVLDNFPFYSSLLMEFLGRCCLADLTVEMNVVLLYRVSKVFSLPGLVKFIKDGEQLLLDPDSTFSSGSINSRRSSPSLSISSSSIKAVFVECVGSSDYSPIFCPDTLNAIHSLLFKVCLSKAIVSKRFSSPDSPGSPSNLSPHQSMFISPSPLQPLATITTQPTKTSLWRRIWRGLVDAFSDDPYYTSPSVSSPVSDPKKLVNFLDAIATNLSSAFKISIPEVSLGETSVLGGAVPVETMPTIFPGYAPQPLTPSSLEPEYVRGTNRLSPQGKMQVILGLRKCSNMSIYYQGDPLLQPIRSYENSTLVRLVYHLSTHLNEKFALQLASIGGGQSLWKKLLLQLLAPPPPGSHDTPMSTSLEPPSTPVSRVAPIITYPEDELCTLQAPRINLRPLGSYYTLTYIFLVVILVWLLSVPLLYCLPIFFCFVLLYCMVGYCLYGAHRYAKKLN